MKVIKKLGEGAFAKVFLIKKGGRLVAVKKTIPSKKNNQYSLKEISILKKFKDSSNIVNIIDHSINKRENKIHLEYLGDELNTVIEHYSRNKENIPISVVKLFTKQLIHALIEMNEKNVLHNDLKPENILFTTKLHKIFHIQINKFLRLITKHLNLELNDEHLDIHIKKQYSVIKELSLLKMQLKISDFGNAISKEILDCEPDAMDYTIATRYYRSPESILKIPYWTKSDIWSLGCIIYELLTCDILFDPIRDNNMSINSYHIAIMIKTFGEIPDHILDKGKRTSKYFIKDSNGSYVYKFNYLLGNQEPLIDHLTKNGVSIRNSIEANEFLKHIFVYDPSNRASGEDLLMLPWLNKKKLIL